MESISITRRDKKVRRSSSTGSMGIWRPLMLLVIWFLLTAPCAPGLSMDQEGSRAQPSDTGRSTIWSDDLDDMSSVYLPPSGLVGVEVEGGAAKLKAGDSEGWISSSRIEPPPGHRYDLVVLDAHLPGSSYLEVSILDANAESTVVGFANATVPGYVKLRSTEVYIFPINHNIYTSLRIQVNLHSDGLDRPELKGWSLLFIELGLWRDDFIGTSKMVEHGGINVSDGSTQLNLTTNSSWRGGDQYPAYPAVACAPYSTGRKDVDIFYPNDLRTGYNDKVSLSTNGATLGVEIEDLNRDGRPDLIVANNEYQFNTVDSEIFWGQKDGKWITGDKTDLKVLYGNKVEVGDVNGDGLTDIVFGCKRTVGTTPVDSAIFLGRQNGTYGPRPDLVIDDTLVYSMDVGDINNDGYDDVIIGDISGIYGHMGGPHGPSSNWTFFISANYPRRVRTFDVDLDGYLDVLITTVDGSQKASIYLGAKDGPDSTADYKLSIGSTNVFSVDAGDVNGDGFVDIAYVGIWSSVLIFKGSSSGWKDSDMVEIQIGGYGYSMNVADVDKDGYDDVLVGKMNELSLTLGDKVIPTNEGTSIQSVWYPQDMDTAVPKNSGTSFLVGGLVTRSIVLPEGNKWDLLYVKGDLPRNSSITFTILDGGLAEIPGYEDLVGWDLDLSGIGDVRTIHVRVTMTTELNNSTPSIDLLMVNWMDVRTWRDQFYGGAKIERALGLHARGGALSVAPYSSNRQQLLFTSLQGDNGTRRPSLTYLDRGGLEFRSEPALAIDTQGAMAVDHGDVNGDGFNDLVFAEYMYGNSDYRTRSPLYLGSAIGWLEDPYARFNTTGARDVLMRDLNGDGYMDLVFAQEQDGTSYHINSTLFWGSSTGWGPEPDIQFPTWGASDVQDVDVNGDDDPDLVFACYSDSSTATDSLVFLQESGIGFNTTSPLHLPTHGARAVSSGDINGDGMVDLVFANSFSGGSVEIDSFIYWGRSGGDFSPVPGRVPTVGAEDAISVDLDADGDLDLVFANRWDNYQSSTIDSYVYLNDGSGEFSDEPEDRLPTIGATAVIATDLDGSGWMDLVFASGFNGSSYELSSRVFLGGPTGWPSMPDMELPTFGATDILAGEVLRWGTGGYLSEAIDLDPLKDGTLDILSCTAVKPSSIDARVSIVDADSLDELVGTAVIDGEIVWDLTGSFKLKEHPSVRVMIRADGIQHSSGLALDELVINWTDRVLAPPELIAFDAGSGQVLRTDTMVLTVSVLDEFDPARDLMITVTHRSNGTDEWGSSMVTRVRYGHGNWTVELRPHHDTVLGPYDISITVSDSDDMTSIPYNYPRAFTVLNNVPTQPEVRLVPARAITTTTLRVELVRTSSDVEGRGLTYHYLWFRDGALVANLTGDSVPSSMTSRDENWSIEVRAFDGDDEGPASSAYKVIQNAKPVLVNPLPDPELLEDTEDSEWLDLSIAFEDPDGDPLEWFTETPPVHISVDIDSVSGKVTITPQADWNGVEAVTFVASDGELQVMQVVNVRVLPVNDPPRLVAIDGEPIVSDPVEYTIMQGDRLLIVPTVVDVEGHEIVFSVNTSAVTLDETTGGIWFTPDNDAIGTLRFGLTIHDVEAPYLKVFLNFSIHVVNENDPMDGPTITSPEAGDRLKVNTNFYLSATCFDPDLVHGQVLNFTWVSDIDGLLGHGNTLETSLSREGRHNITLTVSDGEYERSAEVDVEVSVADVVDPDPDPDPDGSGGDDNGSMLISGPLLGIVLMAIVAVIGAVMMLNRRRRSLEDTEEEVEEVVDERKALERIVEAVKQSADALEASKSEDPDRKEADVNGMIEMTDSEVSDTLVSMEATVTAEPSNDVRTLWAEIDHEQPKEIDTEELRLDSLKRSYHNAIGSLPYGVPSPELRDREWTDLSAALATGKKKTVEGGREVTEIGDRWYYSDASDSGTLLREYGAQKKVDAEKVTDKDRQLLLAKLEERFILGEISEETYMDLKGKYGGG